MEPTSVDDAARDPAGLIAVAIEAEKKAAWFYRTMAEMTSDPPAKMTLEDLSNDEISHAETLTKLIVEMTGHGVGAPTGAAVEGWPEPFDFPSVSRRAALEFALKNELKAAELYQSQADACDEVDRVEIFNRLAETKSDTRLACDASWSRRHKQPPDGPKPTVRSEHPARRSKLVRRRSRLAGADHR